MKKLLKISLVLMSICFIAGSAFAAISCKLELKTEKAQYEEGNEFTVDFYLSNIESSRGMATLNGTLEYDKDSLTLKKIEGKNGWETPTEGASFNPSNGIVAIGRSGFAKSNEVIFTMTFTVKEGAKKNPTIALKGVRISDGKEEVKFNEVKKTIEIKGQGGSETDKPDETDRPGETDKPGETNKPGKTDKPGEADKPSDDNKGENQGGSGNQGGSTNINAGSNSSKDQTTVNNKKLPKTGVKYTIFSIIGIIPILAIYTIRRNTIRRKARRR